MIWRLRGHGRMEKLRGAWCLVSRRGAKGRRKLLIGLLTANLKSKRKKRVIVSNEPLEVHDSDSDDLANGEQAHRGTPLQAVVVDSPSPIKKKRAPKKNAASRIKSNEFILDEVDDDDEPRAKRREEEVPEEDENMYDQSFINDGSSDVHAMSPQAKQSSKSTSKGKEKAKAKSKSTTSTTTKRKKQIRVDELFDHDDPALHPLPDDAEDDDFVPDSADEAMLPPPPRSTRKGKQKQQAVEEVEEESVVPAYPMDVAYSEGPDDEGEHTETDAPGPSTKKKPRNPRVAALADGQGDDTTTGNELDEYGFTDDDLVDLTEEDPIDMGVIDVDLYDDAPSQRFRDFEADYGQVKNEPGADGNGNDNADEFDDLAFDQSFMDNLQDFDYHDPGPDMQDEAAAAGPATTYTRPAMGVDYDDVESEDDDDAERFIPISELSEADMDFFLNHWRRSATEATGLVGSEKQLAEAREQSARGPSNARGRGRGGRGGGGGKWRGGRSNWRGRR